jgi:hypothetical protein
MLVKIILTKIMEVIKMIDTTFAIVMLVGVIGCLIAMVINKIKNKKEGVKNENSL